jgi:acyl-CoA thioesterase FadM
MAAETFPKHACELRPRFEGSNINTWIGFKHVMYLVEEAVLATVRAGGVRPQALFEEQGLGFDIVDSDARILTALHMDDVARFEVAPAQAADGELTFKVAGQVERAGQPVKAVTANVRAVLRQAAGAPAPSGLPPFLAAAVRPRVQRAGPARPVEPPAGAAVRPAALGVERGLGGLDERVAAVVPRDANAFVWRWHVPYFYCHFNERMQHSGYLRLMEEVVDLFLAERGISIRTMLDTRKWIPVVPSARISLLDEALMEETLYTVYTVEEIFKKTTYTSRMDVYALRGGSLVQTATGRITHGYARILDRRDWSLVEFDAETLAALGSSRR